MSRFTLPVDFALPWWAKALAGLLVVALIVLGTLQVQAWRTDAKANAAQVDDRDAVADSTAAVAQDLQAITAPQAQVEHRVVIDTAAFQRDVERASHDPTVAGWLDGDVPGVLREYARARRIARDRLGTATPGGADADPPAPGTADR